MTARREVWITGVGLLTCLGEGLESLWSHLERGDPPPYDDKSFAPYVVRRRIAPLEVAPDRLQPLAQAGEKTNASDPHLAACGHFTNSLAGKLMRSAHSHNPVRSSGAG